MKITLDLKKLSKELHSTQENINEFDEEVNPYLLHTVLPRLGQEPLITLGEIDFEQFEMDDASALVRFFEWQESLAYHLTTFNNKLCSLMPSTSTKRVFI